MTDQKSAADTAVVSHPWRNNRQGWGTRSPTCGPFLENVAYTRADGKVFNSTREPFSDGNFGDNYSFETNTHSSYNSL